MSCKVGVRGLLVAVAMMGMARLANADLIQKDSALFGNNYEMDALPSTSDFSIYNANGAGGAGTASVAGSVLTFAAGTSGSDPLMIGDEAGKLWSVNYNVDNGYTIEARVKVAAGGIKPLLIQAGPADGQLASLSICPTGEIWGTTSSPAGTGYYTTLGPGTEDNTDAFHVFRLAQNAGSASWQVWRDGVLLDPSLTGLGAGSVITASGGTAGSNRFYYGDSGGDHSGTSYTDYLRFDFTGAYAPTPVPEPSCLVLVASGMVGLLAYAWRKRK